MGAFVPQPERRSIVIRESSRVAAPLDRVFALSTSVPLVERTLGFRAVEGVTTGHVIMGSRVLWKGWLFGLPQRHLTLITGYAAPHRDADGVERASFQDTQEAGRFRSFHHDHRMTAIDRSTTLLEDEIHYTLPFGVAGWVVARFVMQPFIAKTLRSRFLLLQRTATGEDWRRYVDEASC